MNEPCNMEFFGNLVGEPASPGFPLRSATAVLDAIRGNLKTMAAGPAAWALHHDVRAILRGEEWTIPEGRRAAVSALSAAVAADFNAHYADLLRAWAEFSPKGFSGATPDERYRSAFPVPDSGSDEHFAGWPQWTLECAAANAAALAFAAAHPEPSLGEKRLWAAWAAAKDAAKDAATALERAWWGGGAPDRPRNV